MKQIGINNRYVQFEFMSPALFVDNHSGPMAQYRIRYILQIGVAKIVTAITHPAHSR